MDIFKEKIAETSTTTGTGTLTLSGALTAHIPFSGVLASGDSFPYSIYNTTVPSEWEVGIGSLSGSTTLKRIIAPTNISGLQLWLKADGTLWQDSARTTPATADSDPVGAWDDASGNGRHFTQATSGKRPLLRTSILNSKAIVRFDKTDDYLTNTTFGYSAAFTAFIVFKTTGLTPYQHLLESNGGGTAQVMVNSGAANLFNMTKTYTSPTYTSWHILEFNRDGSNNGEIRVNNVSIGTGTMSSATGTSMFLGIYQDGTSEPFGGDMAEIILYDSVLSSTDRADVTNYLNNKYGLSTAIERILASSNSGNAVNFSAGTKQVNLSLPAAKASLPNIQTFTSNGTWTKPPGAVHVEVFAIGQGGGGGAGGRGPAGNIRRGGGGGGSGAVSRVLLFADDLGATESVTIGSSANGGTAQTADSSDGSNGSPGTGTSFGNWVYAPGGNAGVGGGFNNTGGTGGTAVGTNSHFQQSGAAGATASGTGGAGGNGSNVTIASPTGGGSGAGITSGNATSAGGFGGGMTQGILTVTTSGPAATVSGSGNSWVFGTTVGYGGGGGSSNGTKTGGNGGPYGGGGGGGAASLNGSDSGAGGNGGGGVCVVVSW